MITHSSAHEQTRERCASKFGSSPGNGDGCDSCKIIQELLHALREELNNRELTQLNGQGPVGLKIEYYSPAEFAELVGRTEQRVREWCRLERINAEKCDTGYGDSKRWKIPVLEYERYRNHGLLPVPSRY